MKLKELILVLILFPPSLLFGERSYYFEDITEGHNLSNIGFQSICEDEDGFVWCGGMNGLYYHNTVSIHKVDLDKNKSENVNPVRVYNLYKDHNNTIWVCTQNGLYKYIKAEGTFKHIELQYPDKVENQSRSISNIVQLNEDEYLLHKERSIFVYKAKDNTVSHSLEIFGNNISYLNKDESGEIFIGTYDGEIYELQDSLNASQLLYHSPYGGISSICKDGNKYYIGYTHRGLDIINSNGITIEQLNSKKKGNKYIKNDFIRQIIKRQNGEIWIGTNEGIYIHKNNTLTLIDSRLESGLPHRRVYSMHKGLDDKIWVSTYSGGVAFYSKYNYKFKHILLDYPQKDLDKSHVATICEDDRGYIWVGSEDEGSIKVYNPSEKIFVQELPSEILQYTKDLKTIVNIGDGRIAFGKGSSNRISIYDYKRGTLENDIILPLKTYPGVRGAQYSNGTLWAYDPRNLIAYDINTRKVKSVIRCTSRIWQLYIDSSRNIWVCTTKGLYVLRPGKEQLELCTSNDDIRLISNASIYSVCEDRDGAIWVGTTGHGLYLYHPESKEITAAPDRHLSADTDIYNLIKDHQNDIWYITNKGLFHYSIINKKTDFYGTNKGTLNAENRLNASFLSSSGKIYFGAKSGFTIVDPSSISKNTIAPSVFLADFKVNDKKYKNDSSQSQNALSLSKLKTIKLDANQNTLSFKVVSNNYIKSERNQYKYRLLNYDNKWIEVNQGQDILFTKVPSGDYIFEAYGCNNDMVWSEQPYQLKINILYPIYLRWYALLTYFVLLVSIGWWVYKELNTKLKLRKEIEEAHNKTKVNELIHSERVKLFTNISHELRTPLSLIISPIKHILQNNSVNIETRQLLQVVNRNAERLQKTADQTIDFRLLEVGKLKPSFEKHELIQLTKDVFLCFEQEFIDREIKTSFSSDFKNIELIIDGDMIEKIIYNLLSNALKHTPEKEQISIHISRRKIAESDYSSSVSTGDCFVGQAISIAIKDTGTGIRKELLPHIFERFTKGEQAHQVSTGIGLHLCKEYSKMNKGNMQLITEDGKGTSFTLNLPFTENTHFEKSELKQLVKFDLSENTHAQKFEENKKLSAASILIVEDNGELRDFLKTALGAHFKIITAKNGEQALLQLEQVAPNLILTDVSMPGISGIELTKQLKQNHKHYNIPIIVMTAYADRSYQMESLLNGADAFFTKPIDLPLLLAQINNSLKNNTKPSSKGDSHETIIHQDDLIEKAKKIVIDNLQNENFQIPDLLDKLNTSKSTLTRKLKAETQQNISGFIRDIRLTNAKTLLSNKQFNIDEIATFVGFSYTSYFIKSFKDKYGITPSEYRKQMKARQ